MKISKPERIASEKFDEMLQGNMTKEQFQATVRVLNRWTAIADDQEYAEAVFVYFYQCAKEIYPPSFTDLVLEAETYT